MVPLIKQSWSCLTARPSLLDRTTDLHLWQPVDEQLEVLDRLGAVPLLELGGHRLGFLAQRWTDGVEVLEFKTNG